MDEPQSGRRKDYKAAFGEREDNRPYYQEDSYQKHERSGYPLMDENYKFYGEPEEEFVEITEVQIEGPFDEVPKNRGNEPALPSEHQEKERVSPPRYRENEPALQQQHEKEPYEFHEDQEEEVTFVPDIEGEKLKILSMVSDLSSRLHLSLSVRDTIENELSKNKKELERAQAIIEEHKRVNESQKKKIETLEYEYAKNKNSLKKTWETVEDLKIKMGIRDSELHTLNRTLKECVAREEEYRIRVGELEEEVSTARNLIKRFQKENETIKSKLMTAEQKAALVDKLETELTFALEDKSAIMEKILILESQLQTANTARESLEKELTDAKRALTEVSSALLTTHVPLPKKPLR